MTTKILIVDDDLESLKLIGLMLEGRGYQIIAAQNGPQALSKAASDPPSLIILDVMMPGMDGIEVCRRLRNDPRTANVPVIMFTAKTMMADKVAGFEAGADEYLNKPIHPAELTARVEALLARSARMGAGAAPALAAKVVGVLGSKGGVGTSTIAANIAVSLARGPALNDMVMLAEFRNGASTLALQLGLSTQLGLQALIEQPAGSLTIDVITSKMERHTSGVLVLSGAPDPLGAQPTVDAPQAEAVLRSLGQESDYLIVDMGSGTEAVNQALLPLMSYILVVTEPQRVTILLTQSLLANLDHLNIGRHRVGVVQVNKNRSAKALTKEMVEGLLQREIIGMISPAPELAYQALEQGIPMVMLQAGVLAVDQIHELAKFITTV